MKQKNIDTNDERSMAYRDMWKILYQATRKEGEAHNDELHTVDLVDIVLMYITRYDVNPLHIRSMISQSFSICLDSPFPTLAQLRRLELEDIANGVASVDCDLDELPF